MVTYLIYLRAQKRAVAEDVPGAGGDEGGEERHGVFEDVSDGGCFRGCRGLSSDVVSQTPAR